MSVMQSKCGYGGSCWVYVRCEMIIMNACVSRCSPDWGNRIVYKGIALL